MSTELQQSPFPTIARIPAIFGGFTPRQSAFIDNYIGKNAPELTGNGVKSAAAAGYSGSYGTLAVSARQLLKQPKVIQEIKRRLGTAVASSSEVLETLTKHARADITDLIDKDGNFNLKLAKRRRILKKLKVKTRYERDEDGKPTIPVTETEYEIHDPQSALEKLGRFHGLFAEKNENINVNITLNRHEIIHTLSDSLADVIDVTPENPSSASSNQSD